MSLVPITTEDGSVTFRSIKYDQFYHTKSGGKQEAIEKFAMPLSPWNINDPVIFDVGFGLGYATAGMVDVIRKHGNTSKITIYCFENDKGILKELLKIDPGFDCSPIIKEFIERFLASSAEGFEFTSDNVHFHMLFGDATKRILDVPENADVVLFVPFSKAVQPEMWSKHFFADIYNHMKEDSKLTTYSYARSVREDLKAVGFELQDGPILGRTSPSTIAIKGK